MGTSLRVCEHSSMSLHITESCSLVTPGLNEEKTLATKPWKLRANGKADIEAAGYPTAL